MDSTEEIVETPEMKYHKLLGGKWYVPEEVMRQTPSVKRGMSMCDEFEARRRGIRFIKNLVRYLSFEKVWSGNTLDNTKSPRVFPTAVHVFHRFYTVHPFQIFNEYVTAAACVFIAAKIEEHILPLQRVMDLTRINARSLEWVTIPDELSFDKSDWADVWKNEIVEMEFYVFTTINPFRFLYENIYGFILQFLRKFVGVCMREDEAIKIRDKAFPIASDVYSCGCPLVVTESTKMLGAMCLMMTLKGRPIPDWKGKLQSQRHWYQMAEPTCTIEKLRSMEREFYMHVKQYNQGKAKEESTKVKGVSPSSDYGSEGSITSNPVSPSDSMCSERDISNEPTSPAVSTASSSDHGVALDGKEMLRRPIKLSKMDFASPCQISLSVRKDVPSGSSSLSSSSAASSVYRQRRKLEVTSMSIEPVQKKMKLHSPVRYP